MKDDLGGYRTPGRSELDERLDEELRSLDGPPLAAGPDEQPRPPNKSRIAIGAALVAFSVWVSLASFFFPTIAGGWIVALVGPFVLGVRLIQQGRAGR